MRLPCLRCGRRATHSGLKAPEATTRYPFCGEHAQWSAEALPKFGGSMWAILNVLYQEGPMSTLALLDTIWPGRAFGAAHRPLVRLEVAGLVQRVPDGRRKMVDLTQLGTAVICTARAAAQDQF